MIYILGTIPTTIGALLTNLSYMSFYDNLITGTIPSNLAQLRSLSTLSLISNQITGTVPSIFCTNTRLQTFSIQNNVISCYDGCLSSKSSFPQTGMVVCSAPLVSSNSNNIECT